MRSENSDPVIEHEEVAEERINIFARIAGVNYPVQFMQHNRRVENRVLTLNERQARHEEYDQLFSTQAFRNALKTIHESSLNIQKIT